MDRTTIPVIDPGREQFGRQRTACSCRACTINCEYIPGYLIPDDLPRIAAMIDPEPILVWCCKNLLASPGATVKKGTRVFNIPTLVPDRQANGWCVFLKPLDSGNQAKYCSIHAAAPFGCAFFDCTQTREQSNELSALGLTQIMEAFNDKDLYANVWHALVDLGRVAPSPAVGRARLLAAWDAERGAS